MFYLIEPTEENLEAYVTWMNSPDQHQTFLLDLVDHCYKFDVSLCTAAVVIVGLAAAAVAVVIVVFVAYV